MTGVSEGPVALKVLIPQEGSSDVIASGTLSWDSANLAGIEIGPAAIPIETSGGVVRIESTSIQLPKGRLHLAGKANYQDDPMWVQLEPGKLAEGVQLETEMTRGWLKYVTPLVADATDVNGTFHLSIDEAVIYPNELGKSKISGRLSIDQAQVGPGPIANNVATLISQFVSLEFKQTFDGGTTVDRAAASVGRFLHGQWCRHASAIDDEAGRCPCNLERNDDA
ncbi:MAG: hypothetical protein R3C05_02775 [Pirellulaceae bacterium]